MEDPGLGRNPFRAELDRGNHGVQVRIDQPGQQDLVSKLRINSMRVTLKPRLQRLQRPHGHDQAALHGDGSRGRQGSIHREDNDLIATCGQSILVDCQDGSRVRYSHRLGVCGGPRFGHFFSASGQRDGRGKEY